ncbi:MULTISPECIES: hypothetical protein [Mycolicibacterium]|uniref:Uncharacterized protein n=1 Tax=Mycolicibacterium llatzerense TaxID=280871 RepID=A0A0D1LA16_9MYCO|nr:MULTISPECIES: hypothetical protein [Mycolicibacterium]KIU17670.1 hypothetical protein TL10_07045 [Mycolicibacterium llatzerense]MCX8565081.1 hypothetical protein [Mycolicibacterium mucogenicum]
MEAIEKRAHRSIECEQRVRKALSRLTKTGIPFTVKDVCDLAGVGKTFIYDPRHPELTQAILDARNASQIAVTTRAEDRVDGRTSSWRERAINAEGLAKKLKADLAERDSRIADLIGQLYDPDGVHLVDENARLRGLLAVANQNLKDAHIEVQKLTRSLDGARANVKRERQRNVTQLFGAGGPELR